MQRLAHMASGVISALMLVEKRSAGREVKEGNTCQQGQCASRCGFPESVS